MRRRVLPSCAHEAVQVRHALSLLVRAAVLLQEDRGLLDAEPVCSVRLPHRRKEGLPREVRQRLQVQASGGVGADGLRALAIDKWQDPALLREYAAARFRKLDSAGAPFAELLAKAPMWDLVLIDGDHSYDGVRRDFDLVRNRTTRYIVLHDIASDEPSCAGVRRFWREVRDQFETHEFVEQYDDGDGSYFGSGVIGGPR